MLAECPECSTRFMVPDAALGAGRDVRCSRCAHVWFLAPASAEPAMQAEAEAGTEDATEEDDGFGEESAAVEAEYEAKTGEEEAPIYSGGESAAPDFVPEWPAAPAAAEKRGAGGGMIFSCIVLLLVNAALGLVLFRDALMPSLPWLYEAAGGYPADGVTLADFTFEQRALGSKSRITLSCNLLNTSGQPRRVPVLRARLVNAGGDVLARESNLLEEGKSIKPGESYPCGAIRMTNPFSSADQLVLDLGSPFDLRLRD